MTFSSIRLGYDETVAVLTLARPERLNALSPAMFDEINAALDAIEDNATLRCLVLTGEGRAFCSGQDLTAELPRDTNGTPDLGSWLDQYYNPLVRRFTAFPLPILAAVNGPAVGAGANLALACDVIIATHSAYFQQGFVRIGLMPDAGGTWFLPRMVGAKRALALTLTGEQVSAGDAMAIGMIHKSIEDQHFGHEVALLARQLADGPTAAFRAIKQALLASGANDLSAQLDLERDLQARLGRTVDFIEGVEAFQQKRPARFQGR